MSIAPATAGLQLPASLETQLFDFRRRVWSIKAAEAVCGAIFGVAVAYLTLFALDRLLDTPTWARSTIFGLAAGKLRWCRCTCIAGCGAIGGWSNWPDC